jgi:1-phosphofructokinase family hexose kinase
MKILTLTLSVAYDVHCKADEIHPEEENLVELTSKDVGGKGINISSALLTFATVSTYVLLPEDGKAEFEHVLKKRGLNIRAYQGEGRIRENITVHHTDGGETRISFRASEQRMETYLKIERDIDSHLDSGDIFALAGSIPEGISVDRLAGFMARLADRGVITVIDSKSFTARHIKRARPFVIKPNGQEMLTYCAQTGIDHVENTKGMVKRLASALGCAVMLTRGSGMSYLCHGNVLCSTKPPKIDSVSTIGAGDSAVAGLIYAVSQGLSDAECLRYATAFGTAACLESGTNPPKRENIKDLLRELYVEKETF